MANRSSKFEISPFVKESTELLSCHSSLVMSCLTTDAGRLLCFGTEMYGEFAANGSGTAAPDCSRGGLIGGDARACGIRLPAGDERPGTLVADGDVCVMLCTGRGSGVDARCASGSSTSRCSGCARPELSRCAGDCRGSDRRLAAASGMAVHGSGVEADSG